MLALPPAPAAAPAAAAGARLETVGRFRRPVYVTSPPGQPGRLFVVERSGRIVIVERGHRRRRAFLDIRRQVSLGGERGMLSMAFAPDYARSRRFYVYYSNNRGDIRLKEFRSSAADPDIALRGSARTLLAIRHRRINHYGGQLQFGRDRDLYVSVGDGGCCGNPGNTAQKLHSLLGKILRIDPRRGRPYRVPAGNPFRRRRGARPEVVALGLRNPWRFSFDRRTGAFMAGDVGQDRFEEIDYRRRRQLLRGPNFGWSAFEGFSRYSSRAAQRPVHPAFVRAHSRGWCAIAGGYVVRDRSLKRLYGRYLYGDFCKRRVYATRLRRGSGGRATALRVRHLVSFGEDAAGRLYTVSYSGRVARISAR